MSTAPISHPSFSIPLFTQLVHRLRRTNARYDLIAYQCRHTYRPTYHAKRRAYRAGLRIDTSKAFPLSSISVFVSDTRIGHEAERKEADGDRAVERVAPQLTSSDLPEAVVSKATKSVLSPLDLEIRIEIGLDVDGDRLEFRGGVPGAPRLRPRPLPLPDDDYRTEEVAESSLRCTRYDAVGLGITIPERCLKRKLRDIDG